MFRLWRLEWGREPSRSREQLFRYIRHPRFLHGRDATGGFLGRCFPHRVNDLTLGHATEIASSGRCPVGCHIEVRGGDRPGAAHAHAGNRYRLPYDTVTRTAGAAFKLLPTNTKNMLAERGVFEDARVMAQPYRQGERLQAG
jgi:hypothetical protein